MFVEVGIGAVYYLRAHPRGGTHFNFTRQFGLGVRHTRGSTSMFVAVRWYHSSNQNMYGRDRNPGFDTVGVFAGLERMRRRARD